MKRVVKYKCDACGTEFEYRDECALHEMNCMHNTNNIITDLMYMDIYNELASELQIFNPNFELKKGMVNIYFAEDHKLAVPNFSIQIAYTMKLGLFVNSVDKGSFSDRYISTIVVVKSIVQGVLGRINE